MERFAHLVLRHRRFVVVVWLVLFLAGGVAAGRLSDRLTFDFSLPGQPGDTAEKSLMADFGVSSQDTLVPTLTMPDGEKVAGHEADVRRIFDAVRSQVGAEVPIRVVDLASTGDDRFVSSDGRTTFGLVQGPPPAGFGPGLETTLLPVLQKAAAPSGIDVQLTSYILLSAGGDSAGPSVLAETLIGAPGALAVLLFVFASFAGLPAAAHRGGLDPDDLPASCSA